MRLFKENAYLSYVNWLFFNQIRTNAGIEFGIFIFHWWLTPIYSVNEDYTIKSTYFSTIFEFELDFVLKFEIGL